jgi:aminomethyltransferase
LLSCGGCKPLSYMHVAIKKFNRASVTKANIVSFNIKGPQRFEAAKGLLASEYEITIDRMAYFTFINVKLKNKKNAIVVKTKIGIEIWSDVESIKYLWLYMLEQPRKYMPCGWDVLNIYRMECNDINFLLYPLDINHKTTLSGINCEWMIGNKKENYVGRKAIESSKVSNKLSLIKIKTLLPLETGSSHNMEKIYSKEGNYCGYITSSSFSPRKNCNLAFAHIYNKYKGLKYFYTSGHDTCYVHYKC